MDSTATPLSPPTSSLSTTTTNTNTKPCPTVETENTTLRNSNNNNNNNDNNNVEMSHLSNNESNAKPYQSGSRTIVDESVAANSKRPPTPTTWNVDRWNDGAVKRPKKNDNDDDENDDENDPNHVIENDHEKGRKQDRPKSSWMTMPNTANAQKEEEGSGAREREETDSVPQQQQQQQPKQHKVSSSSSSSSPILQDAPQSKSPRPSLSSRGSTILTGPEGQERWRAHRIAEDYINIVNNMMFPGTFLAPYGYDPASGQYPLERIATLGILTSPLRRPTVVERWSPYEVATFESALALCGKQFHRVQKFVKSKNTKEIIEFYYIWKKTSHYKAWKRQFVHPDLDLDSDDG